MRICISGLTLESRKTGKMKKTNKKEQKRLAKKLLLLLVILGILGGCYTYFVDPGFPVKLASAVERCTGELEQLAGALAGDGETGTVALEDIPEYSGEPYVVVEGDEPDFTEEERTEESYEDYSELDRLGRCREAHANIGEDLMPDEERGSIQEVKPSGWENEYYDFVEGGYVYNRCHLIGYQLAGENANEKNLITGTRYMNVEGMLPFENQVAEYVRETGNHVLFRVTPIYDGKNLVASGVQMEAESVEDDGESVKFNVYCYNVQPGVEIDYATGENRIQ